MELIKTIIKPLWLALKIWITTSVVLGLGVMLYGIFFEQDMAMSLAGVFTIIFAAVASLPVIPIINIALPWIEKQAISRHTKISKLVLIIFLCATPYGLIGGLVFMSGAGDDNYVTSYLLCTFAVAGILFACSMVALALHTKAVRLYFSSYRSCTFSFNQINQQMETEQPAYALPEEKTQSNKTFFKAVITGILILVMMIPTVFVSNLVTERQQRQADVVKEVSSKWAFNQTVSGPYIYLPYTVNQVDANNKLVVVTKHLWILPENLTINGNITPEIRPRSIYKVLLYKSNLQTKGNFVVNIPKSIPAASLQLADAKICFGISDFKGIEERLTITFNDSSYELSPGLPAGDIDQTGLSAPINLTETDFGKSIGYNMQLKIKGSEQLHFVPLAGNSSVELNSAWSDPSFDGNNLPGDRKVDKNGFAAKWTINKANLPFGTVLQGDEITKTTQDKAAFDKNNFAFGVSMLQPADQYAKTMRSVKYAILFIGLTFSLFFIVELMQKKPLHPVQYVLVGLALVIFYTLLLSVSEFLLFDQAYAIAATGTILLISLYANSHFKNWKTATLFGGVLSGLYAFIFILIRLEDTALLVGSIGLFLVLAMVMYASRKINWYGTADAHANAASA